MRKNKFVIISNGMGGMLAPPNHPSHNYSVHEKYSNGRDAGSMSLDYALTNDEVPSNLKALIKGLFEQADIQLTEEWEQTCYNYFRNCYSPDGVDRNASNCIVDRNNEAPSTNHLAYLHIKQYFPKYTPNETLIHQNGEKGAWSAK